MQEIKEIFEREAVAAAISILLPYGCVVGETMAETAENIREEA